MIGGKVIETMVCGDRVWINTREYLKSQDLMLCDTCAIYVENSAEARSVSVGDIVWWQGKRAFWTPKNRHGKTVGRAEVVLNRRGFSGVSRPTETAAGKKP